MREITVQLLLTFFVLFLYSGCVYTNAYLASELVSEVTDEDRRRRAVVKRNRGGNQCEDFDRCEDICDQLLDHAEDKEDCYQLSLEDIGRIEEVFITLKANIGRDVEAFLNVFRTRSKDLELFMEYGARSWINIIQGDYRGGDDYGTRRAYSPEEKVIIILWALDQGHVQRAIEESSYGDLILQELLGEAVRNAFSFLIDKNLDLTGLDPNDFEQFVNLGTLLSNSVSEIHPLKNILNGTDEDSYFSNDSFNYKSIYGVNRRAYNADEKKELILWIISKAETTERSGDFIFLRPEQVSLILDSLFDDQDFSTYSASEKKVVLLFGSDPLYERIMFQLEGEQITDLFDQNFSGYSKNETRELTLWMVRRASLFSLSPQHILFTLLHPLFMVQDFSNYNDDEKKDLLLFLITNSEGSSASLNEAQLSELVDQSFSDYSDSEKKEVLLFAVALGSPHSPPNSDYQILSKLSDSELRDLFDQNFSRYSDEEKKDLLLFSLDQSNSSVFSALDPEATEDIVIEVFDQDFSGYNENEKRNVLMFVIGFHIHPEDITTQLRDILDQDLSGTGRYENDVFSWWSGIGENTRSQICEGTTLSICEELVI